MTEEEARDWIGRLDVPRGTSARLDRFAMLIGAEATRQNLVAGSTLDALWCRHIVDSLQLLPLAPEGAWLDIGSGAGFPGLMIAAASARSVTLTEPRRLRADFLNRAAVELGVASRVHVHAGRVETLCADHPFAVVSARAVAPLDLLFRMAAPGADRSTVWLLPRGRHGAEELAAARRTWQGAFELVPSITDPAAAIVVARDLRPRTRR